MHSLVKVFVFTSLAAFIGGCASKYVAPEEGPTATLHMPSKKFPQGGVLRMMGIGFSDRFQYAVEDETGCGSFVKATDFKDATRKFDEYIIPANKNIFIRGGLHTEESDFDYCLPVGSFQAEEGYTYTVKGLYTDTDCRFEVTKADANSNVSAVDVQDAYYDKPFGVKICKDVATVEEGLWSGIIPAEVGKNKN